MIKLLRVVALSIGALTLTIPLLAGCFWLLSAATNTYLFHYGFDQGEWLAIGRAVTRPHELGVVDARTEMIPDLLAHHLRPGMSLTEARKLLGPPDNAYAQFDSTTTVDPTAWPPFILEYKIYEDVSNRTYLDVEFVNNKLLKAWNTNP